MLLNAKQAHLNTKQVIENRKSNHLKAVKEYCETVIAEEIQKAISNCKYYVTIEITLENSIVEVSSYLRKCGYQIIIDWSTYNQIITITW